ncbi:MAG TPA: TerB family tellurite resistance protein [Gemmatimonadales bacterium]|jgi:uncharacterized tellurite resistance protein B-like protein|nr:TerB family tellurite resistance protein [Gemmatimonadales bacterium]
MIEAIRRFFNERLVETGATAPDRASDQHSRIQLAACALLLELAHADDEFSAEERTHIESTLARHFGLPQAEVAELMALAESERSQALDHFQFTRLIASEYDLGQKMVLAEVMWGVILADGKLSDHETHLLRKMASLMQIEPGYLAEARRSAAARS